VRSVWSTLQGMKLAAANQFEAGIRAMVQKRDMLVTLASNQRQERPGTRSSLHCRPGIIMICGNFRQTSSFVIDYL